MNKKSQGLPLNTIIIAAIGLIVLFVIAYIFWGESNKFVKSTNCPARGGVCLSDNLKGCPEDKQVKIYTNDCMEVELSGEIYVIKKPQKGPGQCCIPLS